MTIRETLRKASDAGVKVIRALPFALALLLPACAFAEAHITDAAQAFLDAKRDAQHEILTKVCCFGSGCALPIVTPLIAPLVPPIIRHGDLTGKSAEYAKRYDETYGDMMSIVHLQYSRAGTFVDLGVLVLGIAASVVLSAAR